MLGWSRGKADREFWEVGWGRAGTEKQVQIQRSAEKRGKEDDWVLRRT